MVKSIYRINAMVSVLDPSLDTAPHLDSKGNVKRPARIGVRMVHANEPVELDEREGNLYLERHGGTVEEKPGKAEKAKTAPKEKTDETDKPA